MLMLAREFLGNFPGGMFRYLAEGPDTLDCVSAGMLSLFGCADTAAFSELAGDTFTGLGHPDDRERVLREIREQVAERNDDHVRYRILRADGEVRWVEDWGHLAADAEGRRWFYVTLMDITDQVRDEGDLRRANERLEILTALQRCALRY